MIARRQRVDGSLDGQVGETAASLAALVLMGHTSRRGIRRRAVAKAARWLGDRADAPEARLALELLRCAESGDSLDELRDSYWDRLFGLPGFAGMADLVWPEHG
jgi:hypothetical protein